MTVLSFGVLGAYLGYYYKQVWIRFNHSRYAIIGLSGFFPDPVFGFIRGN